MSVLLRSAGSPLRRRERALDGGAGFRRTVAEQTSAAASAADLRGRRARGFRACDETVDHRRRDARREPLAVIPFDLDLLADLHPIALLERLAHRERRVADPLETVEDMRVAVDVPLGDLPVVRAGISRRARISENDSALELAGRNLNGDAAD